VPSPKPLQQETWETSEFAWLSTEELTEESLKAKLTDFPENPLKEKLSLLRNALYTKYHYKFPNPSWSEVFRKYSWYQPTDITMEGCLGSFSPKEKANRDVIISIEHKI
jgi:hypothetical protein